MHSVRRVVDFVRARKGHELLNLVMLPSLSIVADDERDSGHGEEGGTDTGKVSNGSVPLMGIEFSAHVTG